MNTLDWMVVAASCGLVFVVGLWFARKSSQTGAAGYFAGDRDVPWWAIALSNTATYSSGTGAFVMLVLVFGLAGNWLWWASWIVWMPLVAVVWARLWRRMQIVTTAELISLATPFASMIALAGVGMRPLLLPVGEVSGAEGAEGTGAETGPVIDDAYFTSGSWPRQSFHVSAPSGARCGRPVHS